jgi:Ca-activated chloride channel homolog
MKLVLAGSVALALSIGTAFAQGPTVVILSPRADDFISGPIVLKARVEPASRRPERMTFFADGRVVCTIERQPFECAWDAGASVIEHHVRVVAAFEGGSRAVANVRTKDAGYVEAVDVDIVQVPLVVTHAGRFVEGLNRGDFALLQDGVPQEITYFASQSSPLEVTVAIDVSGSMSEAMDTLKVAVKGFVAALRPQDSVTLLGFNDMLFTLARNVTDPRERLAAIDQLAAWGGTALYDAAIGAIDMSSRCPGRKALIMFTDGEDRVSRMTVDDARARLEASNVMFYAIAQGRAVTMPDLRRALDQFAVSSGGAAFFERDEKMLARVFQEIVDELSHHYMLGYAPPETGVAGWHRIEVRMKGEAAARKYRVRAREGYRQGAAAVGK